MVPNVSEGEKERDSAAAAAPVEVSGPGGVIDGGARKFLQPQHSHGQEPQPPAHQQAQLGAVQLLVAGAIAGAIGKTCTAPLARLTILFQVQGMHSDAAAFNKTSICHESLRIINEEGFRAFWKGNLVTIVHRLPYSAVNFYAYEQLKSFLASIPCLKSHRGAPSEEFFVHFVGGGLAGMAAASATYPLDLVRTRLAAQRSTIYYRGIWHATHTICRDEGFLGLYKGMGATLLGAGPSIAISFTVYETLRSYWLSHRPNDSTPMISLACGGLSGIVSSTATFPLDLVRRRMQLEGVAGQARVYKSGLFGTLGHIMRSEGLRGLYRGILPEYYKVVPGLGIVFMSYEALKKLMSRGPLNS